MLSKSQNTHQTGLFSTLADLIDTNHPLVHLSHQIDWSLFESAFKKHYSEKMGKPAKPIRLMVSLLILKHLRNLSDESLVQVWSENVYFQYFGGMTVFTPSVPCSSTELVEFRKRIGTEGVELILKESIRINGKDGDEQTLSIDSTVQEKNITYPTDTKQHQRIIKKCVGIAAQEGIELRQSYKFTIKKLQTLIRFQYNKNGSKAAAKARRKIKTIAARLVRELKRKLSPQALAFYQKQLEIYNKVIDQQRTDKNKIYSLHETEVKCYTKGKEHKKFEFGSKASILVTQSTGVIVGALSFNDNLHDTKTIAPALEQYERLKGRKPEELVGDRGYRGAKQINDVTISTPKPDKNITRKQRNKHKRRAAIEPVIGHLKSDYRLGRNFLKGVVGDAVNLMLSAAAMNFKRIINIFRKKLSFFWQFLFNLLHIRFAFLFIPKVKMTF